MKKIDRLKEELSNFFGSEDFSIEELNSGASVRKYYRLNFRGRNYFPHDEIILMQIPVDRLEIADDYLNISYYLQRHGIAQPRVFEIQREKGWIFLDHAKGERVLDYLKNHSHKKEQLYHSLVDYLIDLQTKAIFEAHCPAFKRYFDKDKFLFEFQFHVKKQLIQNYFSYHLTPEEEKAFYNFSTKISQLLDSKLPIFVHRDFQSSNIFYDSHNLNQPFQIIDFQDARSGTPIYDFVSLLWDSYIQLTDDFRKVLKKKFYRQNKLVHQNYNPEEYEQLIKYTIIQRKLHDAGAFIYSARLTGNTSYLKYIPGSFQMALKTMEHFKEFQIIIKLFKKLYTLSSHQLE